MTQSILCGGVSVLVKSWRWSVKICRYRRLYLCLPFNNLSTLVHKSSTQKAVKIVQRAVYSKKFASCCLLDATYVYIAETWRRPQPVAGFTKVFGCYSNLKENVSNNFKYSNLIYWAFFCHRWVVMDCAETHGEITHMHFLSNLNHDKKLVSEIDCSCWYIIFLNQCICLAQHWTLYITCWHYHIFDIKKIWTKNISLRDFWWRTVWNDLM